MSDLFEFLQIADSEHAVHVELIGADRLDRCQDDRQVLGATAGHHGVDGYLLDRAPAEVRRDECYDLVRGSGGALEHSGHACLGGWDDRKSVGPPAVEQCLVVILELGQFDAAGGESGGAEPCPEFVDPTGFDREGASAGPEDGEAVAEAGDAGELLPAVAVPADGAGDLDAVDPADEYRNDIEVDLPAGDEVGVIDDPVGCSGKRRVVLGVAACESWLPAVI